MWEKVWLSWEGPEPKRGRMGETGSPFGPCTIVFTPLCWPAAPQAVDLEKLPEMMMSTSWGPVASVVGSQKVAEAPSG